MPTFSHFTSLTLFTCCRLDAWFSTTTFHSYTLPFFLFPFARHYIWLPQMAHLSFRILRSCLQFSEISSTDAWKWMWRKEAEAKSSCRLEPLLFIKHVLLYIILYLALRHVNERMKEWNSPLIYSFTLLLFLSIRSWSWQSPSPVSHLSSWQPRRPWRAIVSWWNSLPCPPMLCTHMCQPFRFCARQ